MAIVHIVIAKGCAVDLWQPRATATGIKTLAGGGNLYKTESQCPGPKMRNQDPRFAGGGNLYKTESQYPGPKMWNQVLGRRG